MPCDSVQTSKVQFIQDCTDLDLLMKAMTKLGYHCVKNANGFTYAGKAEGTFDKRTGKFESRGYGYQTQGVDVNAIKRGYSHEVVEKSAEEYGWSVSWSTDKSTGEETAEVTKRQ